MGQKVNPISMRLGFTYDWKSRWFARDRQFSEFLQEDIRLRRILMDKLRLAGVTDVRIERLPKTMAVTILVTRPGVVIGRGGTGIEDLKKFIVRTLGKDSQKYTKIDLRVEEVRDPELVAYLVAQRIAAELERRLPARRVVQKTMERVLAAGASGIKVVIGGRIGGADISRREQYHMGSVPTQTIRAPIDFAKAQALLKKGYVGVKVWIHKKSKKTEGAKASEAERGAV